MTENKKPLYVTDDTTNSTVKKPPKSATPWHYFELAKWFALGTLGISIIGFISGVIAEFYCRKDILDSILSIIKDFLWPFLTLIIGYIFGKGIPEEDKAKE